MDTTFLWIATLLVPQRARLGCAACLLLLLDCLAVLGSWSKQDHHSTGGAPSDAASVVIAQTAMVVTLLVPALAICILSPRW